MKINAVAIVVMILAIAVGKMVGSVLIDMLGGSFGGTIFGTLIVGFVCYAVYNLVAGGKFNVGAGLFFAVLVFFSELIASYVGSYLSLGSGELILYVITGAIMAVLWSYIGGKTATASLRKLK